MYLVNNKLTNHIKDKIGKWQVIHSPKRNFIWYKSCKTAGTAMYRKIMKNEIDDVIGYKDNSKKFDVWWDNLTDKKINDCFTFTFVRNPLDRLVSAFNHVVMEDLVNTTINSPHHNMSIDFTGEQLFVMFNLFVRRGLKTWDKNDTSMSLHWMPQSFLAENDGGIMVDFIGKYENLESDWKFVANKLQISEKLPFTGVSHTGKELGKTREVLQNLHYSHFYQSTTILNMVCDFYKRDIDLFGYDELW